MSRLRAPTPPSRLRLGRHDAPQLPYYLIQTVTHRRVAQSHARSHLLERAAANHEIHNETLLLIRQKGQRRKRIIPLDLRVARMAVHRPHAQHTAACGTRLWQPFFLHTHIDYIFSPPHSRQPRITARTDIAAHGRRARPHTPAGGRAVANGCSMTHADTKNRTTCKPCSAMPPCAKQAYTPPHKISNNLNINNKYINKINTHINNINHMLQFMHTKEPSANPSGKNVLYGISGLSGSHIY